MRALPLTIGSLFLLGFAARAGAAPEASGLVEKLPPGSMDWARMSLRASGSGKPKKDKDVAAARLAAEQAAQAQAAKRMIDTLKKLRVDDKTVAAARLSDPTVRAQVKSIIAGCRPVDTRYFSSGAVDLVLECSLTGGLSMVLQPMPEAQPLQKGAGAGSFSGLILDASGTGLSPTLLPKVYGPDGALLYGAPMVSASALRTRGVAGYAASLSEARKRPRIGDKPIVLKAKPMKGGDLKISDLGRLGGQDLGFLHEGRLVIVTDPL